MFILSDMADIKTKRMASYSGNLKKNKPEQCETRGFVEGLQSLSTQETSCRKANSNQIALSKSFLPLRLKTTVNKCLNSFDT